MKIEIGRKHFCGDLRDLDQQNKNQPISSMNEQHRFSRSYPYYWIIRIEYYGN